MARSTTPFLMFAGAAEAAITFYVSLFPGSAIMQLERYLDDSNGHAGTVKRAEFTLAGQRYLAIDSPVAHDFTFTPAMSIFVECESEAELTGVFDRLADGGTVQLEPGNYGFSVRFGWVTDRFGVSWQLNFG